MLWSESDADRPSEGEPLVFSGNGELLLLARRFPQAWTVAVRSYIGNTLQEVGAFPRLVSIALTPNGRYALIRWADPDKSSTHTVLELSTKRRKDVPSSELLLGAARITDEGTLTSGGKTVLNMAEPERAP